MSGGESRKLPGSSAAAPGTTAPLNEGPARGLEALRHTEAYRDVSQGCPGMCKHLHWDPQNHGPVSYTLVTHPHAVTTH